MNDVHIVASPTPTPGTGGILLILLLGLLAIPGVGLVLAGLGCWFMRKLTAGPVLCATGMALCTVATAGFYPILSVICGLATLGFAGCIPWIRRKLGSYGHRQGTTDSPSRPLAR